MNGDFLDRPTTSASTDDGSNLLFARTEDTGITPQPLATFVKKETKIQGPEESSLTEAMKKNLEIDKIQLRIDNETYLRRHPEIKGIFAYLVKKVLLEKPGDIRGFAAKLLSDKDLETRLKEFKEQEAAIQHLDVDKPLEALAILEQVNQESSL